jgi:signal transduction histidine kinase
VFAVSALAIHHIDLKPALPRWVVDSTARPDQVYKTSKSSAYIFEDHRSFLLIDEHKIERKSELEFLLDSKKRGDVITLGVIQNGERRDHTIELLPFYGKDYLAIHLFVSLAFFFLGVLVYQKRPSDKGAVYFHWICMSVVTSIATQPGHYTLGTFDFSWIVRFAFAIGYCFKSTIQLHFTLVFPRNKLSGPLRQRLGLYAIYAISLVLAIISIVTFIEAANGSEEAARAFWMNFDRSVLFSIMVSAAVVISFIHTYVTSKDIVHRKQMRWVLLGFSGALFGYVLLWQLPSVLQLEPILSEQTMLLFTLCAPIAIVISILRYQIFDIDQILSKAVVYALVLGVLSAAYTIVFMLVTSIFGYSILQNVKPEAILLLALLGVLFEPVRKMVQSFVDSKFFRGSYNWRLAQRSLSDAVQNSLDRHTLGTQLAKHLDDLFKPSEITLFDSAGRISERLHNSRIERLSPRLLFWLTDSSPIVVTGSVEAGSSGRIIAKEESQGDLVIFLALPTKTLGMTGVLALGRKRSGQPYSTEDIDLLNATAQQAGLAIERLLLTEELVKQQTEAQRLKELSEFKSYIVSSISHDLKTPISSIKLYAQMLNKGLRRNASPERSKEFVNIIEGESNRLTALIDNVLDHGRIERGVMQYQKTEIELNTMVTEVEQAMRYLIELQGFESKLTLTQEPLWIHGDPNAIQNVLINLITNAIKYSKERKYIGVETELAGERAIIRVTDKGIGIPADQLEAVFIPFHRVENSDQGLQAKGVGLGLSNVRSMVLHHDGTVTLTSEVGVGSTFTLSFPCLPKEETLGLEEKKESYV